MMLLQAVAPSGGQFSRHVRLDLRLLSVSDEKRTVQADDEAEFVIRIQGVVNVDYPRVAR